MRIKQKLVLGFVAIASLVGVVGYIAINMSKVVLQKSIGETSIALANHALDEIERDIYKKIEVFHEYSTNPTLQEVIIESNQDFDELDNVQDYIEKRDREWTSVSEHGISEFMLELLKNNVSRELREKIRYYELKYGYEVFGEVFITNKYGVNIALTGKTSDYYQADERWWQAAKEDSLYISDIGYDESADVYSMDIGLRIDDEGGAFLGVTKVVLNVREIVGVIDKALVISEYETAKFKLFTKGGKVIYDNSGEYEYFSSVSDEDFFGRMANDKGYFLKEGEPEDNGQEELLAYVCSRDNEDYKGLGWIVAIEYHTSELFASVFKLRNLILSVSLVLAALAVILGLLISNSISKPLVELKNATAKIGAGDMDVQLDIESDDEIGQLAASFKKMTQDLKDTTTSMDSLNTEMAERKKVENRLKTVLQDYEWKNWELDAAIKRKDKEITERKRAEAELKDTQEKLVGTAHKAGMAEVATDVLHNVGNVLNSINVATSLITDKISNSKLANLEKVASIVNEHIHDLGTFLAEDPQGKHIPVYLTEVSKLLVDEQADVISRLRTLAENVEHVKHIISMQQSYARVSGVEVATSLDELIEDAIEINNAGIERHGIHVVREFADVPAVEIDKHKVLQILVNLISNAKYASSCSDGEEKTITVRVYKHDENRFRIEVSDNGIGISRENLTKIFNHGFTTKKNGHGFGLHSGALAAVEMGGSLTVKSDGEGKGATFTLELPYKPVEVTQ